MCFATARELTGSGFGMLKRFHLRYRRTLAPLLATLALVGCATSPGVVALPAPAAARLAVVNLTPHVWRIAVSATTGGEPRVLQVEGGASVELQLSGGEYRIEQTLLSASGPNEMTRRFPATFETGQAYRWPLATLGSAADDDEANNGSEAR